MSGEGQGQLKMDEEPVSGSRGPVANVSAAQVSPSGRVKREQRTGDQQLWTYQIAWWKDTFSSVPGQDHR